MSNLQVMSYETMSRLLLSKGNRMPASFSALTDDPPYDDIDISEHFNDEYSINEDKMGVNQKWMQNSPPPTHLSTIRMIQYS